MREPNRRFPAPCRSGSRALLRRRGRREARARRGEIVGAGRDGSGGGRKSISDIARSPAPWISPWRGDRAVRLRSGKRWDSAIARQTSANRRPASQPINTDMKTAKRPYQNPLRSAGSPRNVRTPACALRPRSTRRRPPCPARSRRSRRCRCRSERSRAGAIRAWYSTRADRHPALVLLVQPLALHQIDQPRSEPRLLAGIDRPDRRELEPRQAQFVDRRGLVVDDLADRAGRGHREERRGGAELGAVGIDPDARRPSAFRAGRSSGPALEHHHDVVVPRRAGALGVRIAPNSSRSAPVKPWRTWISCCEISGTRIGSRAPPSRSAAEQGQQNPHSGATV